MTGLLQLLPIAALGFVYWRRARTLKRRGTTVPAWRQGMFALALVLLAIADQMPFEDEYFWVHMLQHVLLGDLAALAFVLGLTGPLLRPMLAIPVLSRLRVLAHPLVALPLWTVNLYLWHVPRLYDGAIHHGALDPVDFLGPGQLTGAEDAEVLPGTERFGTAAKFGY